MTITTRHSGQKSARASGTIDWTAVQSGVWIGKLDGEFAGMIEAKWGEGFVAMTRLGKALGVFATLGEAKDSFATS